MYETFIKIRQKSNFEIFEKRRQAASCEDEGFKRVKLRKEGLKGLEKFEKNSAAFLRKKVKKICQAASCEDEGFKRVKVRSKSLKLEKFEVGKD